LAEDLEKSAWWEDWEFPDGTRAGDWLTVVLALSDGVAVKYVGGPASTPAQRLDQAVVDLMSLTECRCEDMWTARGRHAPECSSEYREDLEVLLKHLAWPEH
jgi:hypothetical protein